MPQRLQIPLYHKRILPKSTVTGKNRESNFCITDKWCKQPRRQGETLTWKVRVCPMWLEKVCQYSLTQMDCVNFLFCEAHWLFKRPFVTRIGGIVALLPATQRNCVMEKLLLSKSYRAYAFLTLGGGCEITLCFTEGMYTKRSVLIHVRYEPCYTERKNQCFL